MVGNYRSFYILFFALFLSSCATSERKKVAQLRSYLQDKNYHKALKLIEDKGLYADKESQLLKLLEKGAIYYLKGDYQASLQIFDQARDLSDKLYTKSLSKKAKSLLINDRVDHYYAQRYERSLIRLYQVLNHFRLSLKSHSEKKRRRHLQGARATLLEWDSLLEDYGTELAGQALFKKDLLLKLLGAWVHERIGTNLDLNIARQLYKDAKSLLLRNYSLYPSFNGKFKAFEDNFEKFPSLGEKKVQAQFISSTPLGKELRKYIGHRLKNLKKRESKKDNFHLFLTEGLIAPKKAKGVNFPLGLYTLPLSLSQGLDQKKFLSYAYRVLGISQAADASISFELPMVEMQASKKLLKIEIRRRQNKNKGKAGEKPWSMSTSLALAGPLSDIAHQSLQKQMALIKAKAGARLVAKHLVALVKSYWVYHKALKQGTHSLFALTLASQLYALSSKAIKESERADLRHWTSLPHNIWMSSLSLPKGEYEVFLKSQVLGSFKIQEGKKTYLFKNLIN